MTSSSSPSISSTLNHHHHLILTIITTTAILAFCAFWHLAMQYRRWRRILSVQNLTKLKSILYSCSFCIKRAQEKSLGGCIWDKNCTTLCALSESNDHWIKHQDFGQINGEGNRTKHGNKYIMIVSEPLLISATRVKEHLFSTWQLELLDILTQIKNGSKSATIITKHYSSLGTWDGMDIFLCSVNVDGIRRGRARGI